MNAAQERITGAWIGTFMLMGVQNDWLTRIAQWSQKPTASDPKDSLLPGKNLSNWQAGIIAYVILFLLAESDTAAPVAEIVSYAITLTELMLTIPTLRSKFPQLFTSASSTNGASQQPSTQQNNNTPVQPLERDINGNLHH